MSELGLAGTATDSTALAARRPVLDDADRISLPPRPVPRRVSTPDVRIPRPGGLLRPRLLAAIDKVLDLRFCAVVAPPGSGKTTALAHWAGRAAVDVAWWRADADGDDDPAGQVLTGLGAAVRTLVPSLARTPEVEDLAAALDGRSGPVVLVIDDLQQVSRRAAGPILERLLLRTRDHVHLAVSSRVPVPLNLARSELEGAVLGPADLRFRPDEVAALFRTEYDVTLGWEEASALTRRTDGMAAALRLGQHAIARSEPRARRRAVAASADHAHLAQDYLDRTFLAGLDPEHRDFLAATAPFETLLGERCDELLGRDGSAEILDRLVRRGVVVPTDDGSGHVIPRVLRDHLLATSRSDHGARRTEQRFRAVAAILTEAAGTAIPSTAPAAARAWAAGGAWPDLLTLLSEWWDDVVADADLGWLAGAPPEIAAHPLVRTALAERARRDGALVTALDLLSRGPRPTEPTAAATADRIARFCRMWTVGDLQPGSRWTELVRAAVRRPNPDRRRAASREQQTVVRVIELVIGGDLRSARSELDRAVDRITDPDLACAAELLAAALHPAEPARAESAAAQAEYLGCTWYARLAYGFAHLRHDPDLLAAEVGAADDRGDSWGAMLLAATGAVTELKAGRPTVRAFEDVARRCRDLGAPALEAWARSGLALASIAAHLPDAARDAESAVGFAHSAQVPGALALGRVALAHCRDDRDLRATAEAEVHRLGLEDWLAPGRPAVATAPTEVPERRTPPLEVRCFGGFDLLIDGAAPDLRGVRPRARALLRLLALHAGQSVHREVIAEAMWPQLDGAAALHNLHVCVSGLRTALEPGVARGASRLVVRDGDRYVLALPDGSVSDLRSFDDLTAAADVAHAGGDVAGAIADLEAAVALCVGEVLPEDGPTEWVLPHREHYQSRAAEVAARLGRLHLEQRRPDAAAVAARRSIDIDAFRDGSWRLLIAAHEAAGNLAGAEEARRSYADVLASLGVASHAATVVTHPRRG